MHLIRDVLDKQLVDHRHDPLGMADGILVELRGDLPPRVVAVECGLPVLARRIHPRLERIVRAIGRRFGVNRGKTVRFAWSRVKRHEVEIELSGVDADHAASTEWERWLRRHVTRYIPGSGNFLK
jgi:hypothetical protein